MRVFIEVRDDDGNVIYKDNTWSLEVAHTMLYRAQETIEAIQDGEILDLPPAEENA